MSFPFRALRLGLLAAVPSLLAAQTWAPAARPSTSIGFGTSLALQGDELAVGRTGTVAGFPLPPSQPGAVLVYARRGDGWREAATLAARDGAIGDGFGSALARDGMWLAVGAPGRADGGAVYLFRKDGTRWVEAARLAAPGGARGDGFGTALALRGGTLLIGAPGRDSARGEVFTAALVGRSLRWGAPAAIARGDAAGDRLGAALDFDGRRAALGAPGPQAGGPFGGAAPRTGYALVLARAARAWGAPARLAPAEADSARSFGAALRFVGPALAVGAPAARRGSGVVLWHEADGDGWRPGTPIAPAEATPNQGFGAAIAAAGEDLLVGAPFASGGQGAVSVLRRQGGAWTHAQSLATTGAGLALTFGAAIAAGGGEAVIAAPAMDFFEGVAHHFTRGTDGSWRPAGPLADQPAKLAAITGGERKCEGGKVGQFDCDRVDLLGFIPTADLGARRGIMLNDIWGWNDTTTGREFAIVGRMDGTSFVEVTDPANPRFLGDLPMHAGARANMWRDMKVYKDHVFIVADGAGPHGIQVFDLTQLRNVANAPATFTETAHYDRIASAHNIVINEATGFAYAVGSNGGGETCGGALHMVDIRDPRNPTFAGCHADKSTGFQRTGYTHDAMCTTYRGPDTRYTGREICFNASETGVGIADVTDKAQTVPISVATYPNTAYAHQGWLSEDQKYFFLDDEGDEISGSVPRTRTLVWDVSKLDEPVLVKEFLGATAASDHNLYVRGKYMFQSNYVAGLRVIDISDPVNPRETGFFDTVPFGENAPGFAGSWSNYPYFRSGTIIATSMKEGLFVLRHRPPEPAVP